MAPSFFQIMLDPSAPHMSLPPDFVCMHLGNKIPKAPIIRSANGGYCWGLKIKRIGETYCFASGWKNVVKDIQLGFGDFLFFQFVGQSTFKMSVFSQDGCEKHLPQKIEHDGVDEIGDDEGLKEEQEDDDDDDEAKNGDEDGDPCFTTIIAKSHASFLRFPAGFHELVGIEGEGSMTLKNVDGKEWVTGVKLDKSYRSSIRYFLSPKWCVFKRQNGLSEGDECLFKFIRNEGKLLLAKVHKNKWPTRPSGPTSVMMKTRR